MSQGESLTQIQMRPLNVKDALSYLDDVKTQFLRQPDVYNKFLDIMKDFKTQVIDTPGVIERVSQLFRSHPSLIQGFNTFLPPGYRIESLTDQGVVHTIHIHNPSGSVSTRTLTPDPNAAPPPSATSSPAPQASTSSAQPSASASAPETSQQQQQQQPQQTQGASLSRSTSAQPQAAPSPATREEPSPGSSRNNDSNSNNNERHSSVQQQQQQQQQQPGASSSSMHLTGLPAPSLSSAPSMVATPGAAGILTDQNPQKPPVEFNHAINYVNKIKTRFGNDPTTYKNFLEILQTYQKEQKPIKEVYAQVTNLFAGSPDLLDEFKQFLPDNSQDGGAFAQPFLPLDTGRAAQPLASTSANNAPPARGGNKKSNKNADPDFKLDHKLGSGRGSGAGGSNKKGAAGANNQGAHASGLPAAAPQEDRRKRKHAEASATGASIAASMSQSMNAPHNAPVSQTTTSSKRGRKPTYSPPPPSSGMGQVTYEASVPGVGPPIGAYGVPQIPPARPNHAPLASEPLVTVDELAFFDRAKRYIDNKALHQEFLKVLNLFTQGLIDLPTLMEKAYLFLGANEELFNEFKMLVGWDVTEHGLVDGEEWMIENVDALDRPRFDLSTLPGFGPSYKKLPISEVELSCSGRDAHCWSVLNDHWVAHATWASEGSGIHRPNANEEALMISEQERHWFAVIMTTNQRAISILEPVATRISLMDAEQKAVFKLRPGFNDTNPSIIERAVKKVYGTDAMGAASGTRADAANEVISAIYENPAISVPIVLLRMKQKDEDWQRAVREWNKVWREVEAKNFYRALDHQSVPFKSNDKKNLTSRSLVGEIEHLRAERKQKRVAAGSGDQPFVPTDRSQHQFELRMSDKSVILDVMRLTFAYLERGQAGFSLPERERVEGFLRLFVPLVLGVSRDDIEQSFGVFEAKHADDDTDSASEDESMESETGGSTADDQSAANSGTASAAPSTSASTGTKRKGVKASAADLRRRLLASTVNGGDVRMPVHGFHSKASAPFSNGHSNGHASDIEMGGTLPAQGEAHATKPETTSAAAAPAASSSDAFANGDDQARRYNFFANGSFYCLLRIFHMLYHRLQTLKLSAEEMAATNRPSRLNPIAVELGISNPLPIIDVSADDDKHAAEGYYPYLLELCEKYFESELDQSTYEENLRMMWGIKAFPLFTVDKMVSALIKHVHSVNGDAGSQEMLLLLERDRQKDTSEWGQQAAYRSEVESLIGGEDNVFRFEWIPQYQSLTIQLLGSSDEIEEASQPKPAHNESTRPAEGVESAHQAR